jgi:hypothetical protein
VKILIYKSIFGNYDNKPQVVKDFSLVKDGKKYDFEHIIVSNSYRSEIVNGWSVDRREVTVSNKIDNRLYKFNPIKEFPNYDYSCYLDGHIGFNKVFYEFVVSLISLNKSFILNRHRKKGTVLNELIRIIDNNKVSLSELENLADINIDFQKKSTECGFIFRDHFCDSLVSQGEEWMRLFKKFPRDQVLLHESFNNVNLVPHVLDMDFNNSVYILDSHKNNTIKLIKSRINISIHALLEGTLIRK